MLINQDWKQFRQNQRPTIVFLSSCKYSEWIKQSKLQFEVINSQCLLFPILLPPRSRSPFQYLAFLLNICNHENINLKSRLVNFSELRGLLEVSLQGLHIGNVERKVDVFFSIKGELHITQKLLFLDENAKSRITNRKCQELNQCKNKDPKPNKHKYNFQWGKKLKKRCPTQNNRMQ